MTEADGSGGVVQPRALPGGPAASEEVCLDPVAGLDLARLAAVSARVDERAQPVRAVLAAEAIDEHTWLEAQRIWFVRIAATLMRGDTTLALAYDAGYVAAQDEMGKAETPLPLELHARITAALAAGADGALTLARAGVTLPRFARAERQRAALHARDPDAAASFAALVARSAPRSDLTG